MGKLLALSFLVGDRSRIIRDLNYHLDSDDLKLSFREIHLSLVLLSTNFELDVDLMAVNNWVSNNMV